MSTALEKQQNRPQAEADRVRRPRYRVRGDKNEYSVDVFMPGVSKNDYEVTVQGDELLIEGRRSLEVPESAVWIHRELAAERYQLRLQLNVEVDTDGISARSEEGILSVTLPVAREARPRRIEIS